ncbi:MAG TPA: hypothetical protein VJY35_02655 [Candidatus Eisenbacteria bacterium]|nr:hypothetical protein [Candidatus Eisenbacteria bacterium]
MKPFMPQFSGQLALDPLPEDFATRLQRRVESGLLVAGRRDRADYQVMGRDRSGIHFVSRGFLTTYNVGLNDVTVNRAGGNQVRYHVTFWGWTRLAVLQGLLLGTTLATVYLLSARFRDDVASHASGAWLFWGMGMFWSLVWPWVLTALHRPHAERALRRILHETLSDPHAQAAEGNARRAS